MSWHVAVGEMMLALYRVRHWSLGWVGDTLSQFWNGMRGESLPLLRRWVICASAFGYNLMTVSAPGINNVPRLVRGPSPPMCWQFRALITDESCCPTLLGQGRGRGWYGWLLGSPADSKTLGASHGVARASLCLWGMTNSLLSDFVGGYP